MTPSDDDYATASETPLFEVIAPEPSTIAAPPPRAYATGGDDRTRAGAGRGPTPVALVAGSAESLTAEVHDLRRRRLQAAAIALAAIFGLLTAWIFAGSNPATNTADGSRFSARVAFLAGRCLIPAAVSGLLASRIRLRRRPLFAVECLLFLGPTALLVASQYFVGLDLIDRGARSLPAVLAFVKDGVIQMIVLMMVYGTLVPNRPVEAARLLAIMFAAPVLTLALIRTTPEAEAGVRLLSEAEEDGSNALFLAIGAVLSFFAARVLNVLRVELHDARKFGQYRLLKKIGAGGMGEVFLAEHQLLKRPCALKLIKPTALDNPIALARFEREVRSAARLSHPNTIEIYDYGHASDGTFYYVMEYLPGMNLDELVKKAGPLPPGRVIYLIRQACAGLTEAHAMGLVHRDLKPANIFVARRGGDYDVAKVLDFGLVKPTREVDAPALSAELSVSGTPTFMAPEQATGSPALDVRADVYALGAVAYFALTGHPPFDGANAFAVMMAHARDPVVPPSRLRPELSADLEAVVLQALEKKPAHRFADAKWLGRALAACRDAAAWDADQAQRWWAEASIASEIG